MQKIQIQKLQILKPIFLQEKNNPLFWMEISRFPIDMFLDLNLNFNFFLNQCKVIETSQMTFFNPSLSLAFLWDSVMFRSVLTMMSTDFQSSSFVSLFSSYCALPDGLCKFVSFVDVTETYQLSAFRQL